MKSKTCSLGVTLIGLVWGLISAPAQVFVGTNAPGTTTNFTFDVSVGATNLSLVVSNNATAFSYLRLKKGGAPTDTDFDFVSRINGRTNQINLELSEFAATNYGVQVTTPSTSTTQSFQLKVSTNRTDLRSGAYPVLKPVIFSATGLLSNSVSGAWNYYQVDVPTNLPGWRIVLSANTPNTPDLYIQKGQIPTTVSFLKSSTGQTIDTLVFTDTEATNFTYFIGVYLSNTATSNANYTLSTELGYLNNTTWDPGVTHEGTVIFTNTSPTGGNYYFKILPQSTSVGAWRTALNVQSGEAHVYLRQGSFDPSPATYAFKSEKAGADGFVLHSSQFAAGQTWYLCVHATPGAQWTLCSGEAYVMNLGAVAPYYSTDSSTNVAMGAEGMRFFRTSPTIGTLAWRLYLNGATNDILVKKTAVPHPYNNNYDLKQARQMLVVPNYLVGGDQYLIGVVGNPGAMIQMDSRQQEIIDIPFSSTNTVTVTNYGLVTYRVIVPVQQIAWITAVTPTLGDANISVRRDYVPNEWNNDAYSEVPGLPSDSVSLVPPTLTDGTFFVTVYGLANYTATLISGNPIITDVTYVSTTTNDDLTRVGWRYYRVPDIDSQLGTLGWDLFLQSQPAGTELAIRRNAVPGRWNYRQNNNPNVYSQGYVDVSGPQGFIQHPGHQADIWYVGAYNPSNALGNFVLNLRELIGVPLGFDGSSAITNVTGQIPDKFYYWRIDVPPGVLGWDIRLTNVTSGDPRLVVRRDQLPDNLATHGLLAVHTWYPYSDIQWRSGFQWAPNRDWTDNYYTPAGVNDYGRILACGIGNPLEPGTYYVGVLNYSGSGAAMSYTLMSRGIGTNGESIAVTSLAFSNGVANISNLSPREAAYYQVVVPTNRESWKLSLSTNIGDSLLIVEKDSLPNIDAGANSPIYTYGGRKMQKNGSEQYVVFPNSGTTNLLAGTYYVAVVSEGMNLAGTGNSRIGTNTSSSTLTTFGTLMPTNMGTLTGPDLVQTNALDGGEVKTYQFTVPTNVLALEVWLESTAGYPRMSLRADPLIPQALDSYGNDGGTGYTWYNDNLINVANPTPGTYTLTVIAAASGNIYSNANYTVRVRRLTATPLDFDGSVISPSHLAGTWRYYTVTVPPNAMGWDIRLTDVTMGDPRLSVRRDAAPDSLNTHGFLSYYTWYPYYSTNWASSNQWGITRDWTGYYYGPDGTNEYGHVLQMGMGNPLEAGNYIIGVQNSLTSGYGTNEMRYTLVSRGIGPGFTIPVTPLNFTNGNASITNLLPREAAYFSVVVPTNVPSWQLRLGTDTGESLLVLQKDALPNVQAGSSAPYSMNGGRSLQKLGSEHYVMLPMNGVSNVVAGTYYLAVISEGMNPGGTGNSRLGTNTSSSTLQSFGVMPVVNLGTVAPGTDRVLPDTLEGGAIKTYQFNISPGTLSIEARLENRVADPRFTLRPDAQIPYPVVAYGNDGGQAYTWYNDSLVLIANPSNSVHTMIVIADNTGPTVGGQPTYSNASYTVRIHAVGAIPMGFDGGVISVNDHEPNTWRYYLVTNVPTNALGWDVRLTNVISGDPQLVIRRETLPDNLNTHGLLAAQGWYYPYTYSTWPTGFQWGATLDWTGYRYEANGTNKYGHTLQMGVGNPLIEGNYYIGVFNDSYTGWSTNTMRYTLTTRGIGPSLTLPITTLAFAGGSTTNSGLPLREADYYCVDVPSNAPNWKVRLAVGAGDSLLLVQKDYLPNIAGDNYSATQLGGGYQMQKAGNEHYVLLPVSGQTNIPAGRYYLLVASEGLFPLSTGNSRAGTNGSSYLIQSLGSFIPESLGLIGLAPSLRTNSVEGGEFKAYNFTVPAGMLGLEVRLNNRVGNPYLAMRQGAALPSPYYNYGYNEGENYTWQDARLFTLANPAPTNYTVLVQGGSVSPNYPDADYVLSIGPAPIREMAFDATLVGCMTNLNEQRICTNYIYCDLLADNERSFFRVQVPTTLPDGTPVIGWRLGISNAFGNATVRVRKDVLPSDSYNGVGQPPFASDQSVIVQPFLTPGTWYVEVKGNGSTSFCIDSSAVRLQRSAWNMPGTNEPITTPGLTAGPLFGDSGIDTNGVALPGDGGTDLAQGYFHYYAINVPTNNGALFRMVLEAISGNPDLYIRVGSVPTLSHRYDGYSGTLYERSLTGNTTEYGNWIPNQGRYETAHSNGVWYVAVKAGGISNCRYRLRFSTGSVTQLDLSGSVTNQIMAGGDWRYYQFYLPTNAPTNWVFTFQQHVGDVIAYVRDTIPPGQYSSISDYRDWYDDNKNNGYATYRTYDPPGTYTNSVPLLRPGHTYYLGFRAVSDATFSLYSSTNGPVHDLPFMDFYSGSVTNYLAPGTKLRYRIMVPPEATRWVSASIHSNSVRWYLEQGSLPKETTSDHESSVSSVNKAVNNFLAPNTWPWVSNQTYYLTVTNTALVSQPFYWKMNGKNCDTDDYDNDGLPDCWELLYFPSIYSYSGSSDADNDGVSNMQEYLDGTNPFDATSMLARLTLNTNGSGGITVTPGPGPYAYGTPITLTAAPNSGQVLMAWAGTGISGNANPLLVSMTTNRTITAAFGADYGPCDQARADYRFHSNLVSSAGSPPNLTYINSGHYFTNQTIDGLLYPTLRFPQGSGVQLWPAITVFPSNAYTIVLLFKFDTVASYRRVLDTKNAVGESGLYVLDGRLNFYNISGSSAICVTNDTWHQVVITRDFVNQMAVYCDGVPRLSFTDAGGSGSLSATNTLRLFKDNSTEDSAGSVARVRIFPCALSAVEVAALNRAVDSAQPCVLSGLNIILGDLFTFGISGPPGVTYLLQSSSTLTNWTTLTNITPPSGSFNFTNLLPVNSTNQQFFRVILP